MITIFKVSTIFNKHVLHVLLIFLCLLFHTQVPVRLLLLHLPVDWQVSLRLHSCPAPRTTLQWGPVRRRFGHSCFCHVEAAYRSEVFLIHCSIWIYIVFCVLPKTLKQYTIIHIFNIFFPNYMYFKSISTCNSRLKWYWTISDIIERKHLKFFVNWFPWIWDWKSSWKQTVTVTKPNVCCVNRVHVF